MYKICILLTALLSPWLHAESMPKGDPERGRLLFGPCRTCHYPEQGVGHHNGPSLYAIFGKRAGTQPGFRYYSDALKNAGWIWTPQLLDTWLANPNSFLPGSRMIFVALPKAQDRADLIAYLESFCCTEKLQGGKQNK